MTDLSPEIENKLYKNTIKYLYDISNTVPDSQTILKSYYSFKFRIFQHHAKINFEEEKPKNKLQARCPRCCLKLTDIDPSYTVKSEVKRSKFMRKLQNKVKKNKALTRCQTKYLKKLNKCPSGNQLVITCNFCKKEMMYPLHKPEKPKSSVNGHKEGTVNKKPKRKRDPYCGLKIDAVASVQNQNKTIDNKITQRKAAKNKRKNIKKLSNILKQSTDNTKTKSNLNQFLQSFQ